MKEIDWRISEREKYNTEYNINFTYPTNCVFPWENLAKQLREQNCPSKYRILDVGCGPGFGIRIGRWSGFSVYGVDIADRLPFFWKKIEVEKYGLLAYADMLPFKYKSFNMITCFDVLEHLPVKTIEPTLKEFIRVSYRLIYLIICTTPSLNKMMGGKEPHLTIKPSKWWLDKLKKVGIKPLNIQRNQHHVSLVGKV